MPDNKIPSPNEKVSTNVEAGLAGFILPLIVIVIALLGLNYFNILPISKTLPLLSFLPAKEQAVEKKPLKNEKPKITIPFVRCPVKQDLCAKGFIIPGEKDKISTFSAIGYKNLTKGTEILSAMNGNMQVENQTNGNVIVRIINKGRNMQVNYEFAKGAFISSTSSAQILQEGEGIGIITDESKAITKYEEKFSLIFSVQSLDEKVYKSIKPEKEGKYILHEK